MMFSRPDSKGAPKAGLTAVSPAGGIRRPSRSVLVLDSGTGIGTAVATAVGKLYPTWSVAAFTPEAAARDLEGSDIDVVVPIFPGGNGEGLFDWVRSQYPAVGHVAIAIDRPDRLIAAGADTQFAESVARTLVLRDRLSDFRLVAFAAEMKRIPVISTVYQDLCRMLAYDPSVGDYSLADVAELVGSDPGIAARVLRLVNSAMFGLPRSVSNIPQAVALLGARRMATLLLWVSLSDQLRTTGEAGHIVEEDWETARLVAHLSREIATFEGLGRDAAETAYLAGLLHNVGRLLLAANVPDQFAAVDWPDKTGDRLVVEERTFGVSHTALGALLIRFWGMDDILAEAVGFYADPLAGASQSFGPLAAVHSATVMLGRGGLQWDEAFLDQAGLQNRIDAWGRVRQVKLLIDEASGKAREAG